MKLRYSIGPDLSSVNFSLDYLLAVATITGQIGLPMGGEPGVGMGNGRAAGNQAASHGE
jgi:hypothetical protein